MRTRLLVAFRTVVVTNCHWMMCVFLTCAHCGGRTDLDSASTTIPDADAAVTNDFKVAFISEGVSQAPLSVHVWHSRTQQVTALGTLVGTPSFTPDGRFLAAMLGGDVAVVDAIGNAVWLQSPPLAAPGGGYAPSLRSDGERVLVTVVGQQYPPAEIATLDADGSFTVTDSHSRGSYGPSGSKVVTVIHDHALVVMNDDGTEETTVLSDSASSFAAPAFGGDGRVVFVRGLNAHAELDILDINTLSVTTVTSSDSLKWSPQFTPDEKNVVFVENTGSNGLYALRMVSIETGTTTTLVDDMKEYTFEPFGISVARETE